MRAQRILVQDDKEILVLLDEERRAIEQKSGEIILDVNGFGNWIRGFEIVGGFVDFSMSRAVKPFNPVSPFASYREGTVTYDQEANAAYFYLWYDPSILAYTEEQRTKLTLCSHCINPTGVFGLDEHGGLVWIRIRTSDVISPIETFLKLLKK